MLGHRTGILKDQAPFTFTISGKKHPVPMLTPRSAQHGALLSLPSSTGLSTSLVRPDFYTSFPERFLQFPATGCLHRLFSPPGILPPTPPLVYKAARQNQCTLQSPGQMPPPKVTASWKVRARGARGLSQHPPHFTGNFSPTSPHQTALNTADLSDSAKVSAGTMIQTQSSTLSPDFSTSEPQALSCQVLEN